MFNQPDSEFSPFSWLVFGLLGIVFSIAILPALGMTTPIQFIQAMSGAVIVLFVSVQLLKLFNRESLQE